MKHSKRERKFVNQMRSMGDIPWPARRFKYPATLGQAVGTQATTLIGTCKRPVGAVKMRRGKFGRLRRKQDVEVRCGGEVFLRRGSLGKRRVYCADCTARKREKAKIARLERQLHARFGIRREVAEQRASGFKRFLRKGR